MSLEKKLTWIRRAVVLLVIAAVLALLLALVFMNLAPFGARVEYKLEFGQGSENITMPEPLTPTTTLGVDESGAVYQVPSFKITSDQVNFDVKVPYTGLEEGTVKIRYKGKPEEFLVGVRDPDSGRTIFKPIDNQFFNNTTWSRIQDGDLSLFQKEEGVGSMDDFMAGLPAILRQAQALNVNEVSTYYYNLLVPDVGDLPDINAGAVIDSSLRGPHEFSVYVKDQPLQFTLNKQDINYYRGEDPLLIRVFSGYEQVYELEIPDDGDVSDSRAPAALQEVRVDIPGLQEGVYNVYLECSNEVIVRNIDSRQKYLWFANRVFLADNEMYNVGPTKPNTIYTNAKTITALTYHPVAFQTLHINGRDQLVIEKEHVAFSADMNENVNEIVTEKSDVILSAEGYAFSFDEETIAKFFGGIERFTRNMSLDDIDYILTTYKSPEKEGDFSINTVTFNLRTIDIEENRLSFVLSVPGLTNRGEEIVLDSVEITLKKADGLEE